MSELWRNDAGYCLNAQITQVVVTRATLKSPPAITLMKALEVQGNTPEMAWMRQASETAANAGQLWQRYLEIKTGDPGSTTGPVRTSSPIRHRLN